MDKPERKPKRDLDKEYPPWPNIDFAFQDKAYFEDVRESCGEGLDPKTDITDEHVTTADISKLWGNVQKFRTSNPLLPLQVLKGMETLYWRIYGTDAICNKEFQLWFVKGWIAEQKDHKINWAKAAASTAQERKRREGSAVAKKGDCEDFEGFSKGNLIERIDVSEGSTRSKFKGNFYNNVVKTEEIFNSKSTINTLSSLNIVSSEELVRVEDMFHLKQDLWKYANARVRKLEEGRKSLSERVFGSKYSLEECKKYTFELEESLQRATKAMDNILKREEDINSKIVGFMSPTSNNTELERESNPTNLSMANADLQIVIAEKSRAENDLQKSQILYEAQRPRMLQGQTLHQDVQSDSEAVDLEIEKAMMDVKQFVKQQDDIEVQLEEMRKGGCLSFWPKPTIQLHKLVDDDFDVGHNVLVIKPCGYCDEGFLCSDIAVTSCKHTFHPYCLGVMLKNSNECLVCKQKLHPEWWRSWGFREEDDELKMVARELNLEDIRRDALQTLREAARHGLDTTSDHDEPEPVITQHGSTLTNPMGLFSSRGNQKSSPIVEVTSMLSPKHLRPSLSCSPPNSMFVAANTFQKSRRELLLAQEGTCDSDVREPHYDGPSGAGKMKNLSRDFQGAAQSLHASDAQTEVSCKSPSRNVTRKKTPMETPEKDQQSTSIAVATLLENLSLLIGNGKEPENFQTIPKELLLKLSSRLSVDSGDYHGEGSLQAADDANNATKQQPPTTLGKKRINTRLQEPTRKGVKTRSKDKK